MRINTFDIFDISQPISSKTACFPGDVPFSAKVTQSFAESKIVNLTAITLSPHVGTHTDSPAHVMGDLSNPDHMAGALPLDPFVGIAVVLDVSPMESGGITGARLIEAMAPMEAQKKHLEETYKKEHPWPFRYLIKSQQKSHPEQFKSEYPYLTPDAVELLYSRGAKLIGVDTPSIDDVNAKDLVVHRMMIEYKIYWLENLDLSSIEPRAYFLVAAPVKLMETEAAPVRAILIHGIG
jgi:arylformamidase